MHNFCICISTSAKTLHKLTPSRKNTFSFRVKSFLNPKFLKILSIYGQSGLTEKLFAKIYGIFWKLVFTWWPLHYLTRCLNKNLDFQRFLNIAIWNMLISLYFFERSNVQKDLYLEIYLNYLNLHAKLNESELNEVGFAISWYWYIKMFKITFIYSVKATKLF